MKITDKQKLARPFPQTASVHYGHTCWLVPSSKPTSKPTCLGLFPLFWFDVFCKIFTFFTVCVFFFMILFFYLYGALAAVPWVSERWFKIKRNLLPVRRLVFQGGPAWKIQQALMLAPSTKPTKRSVCCVQTTVVHWQNSGNGGTWLGRVKELRNLKLDLIEMTEFYTLIKISAAAPVGPVHNLNVGNGLLWGPSRFLFSDCTKRFETWFSTVQIKVGWLIDGAMWGSRAPCKWMVVLVDL